MKTGKLQQVALTIATIALLLAAPFYRASADGQRAPGEEVVILDPANPDHKPQIQHVVNDMARYIRRFSGNAHKEFAGYVAELPEGSTVRVIHAMRLSGTVSEGLIRLFHSVTTLNADGEPDGYEIFQTPTRPPTLTRFTRFKNGVRHGLEEIIDDHQVQKLPWQEGQLHGARRSYFRDGNLQSETIFEEGKPVGEGRSYSPDGDVLETISYKDGEMHGERVQYWRDNPEVVRRRIEYRMGIVHGITRDYHRNGQLSREMPFREGALHGAERHFDADGNITRTRFWINGDMVPQGRFEREYKPDK